MDQVLGGVDSEAGDLRGSAVYGDGKWLGGGCGFGDDAGGAGRRVQAEGFFDEGGGVGEFGG